MRSASTGVNGGTNGAAVAALVKEFLRARGFDRALSTLEEEEAERKRSGESVDNEEDDALVNPLKKPSIAGGISLSALVPTDTSLPPVAPEDAPSAIADALTELPPTETSTAVRHMLAPVAESLYVWGAQGGDLRVYVEEMSRFVSWMLSAIDSIAPSFHAVGFALFVHCYVHLVRTGGPGLALSRELWRRCHAVFLGSFQSELQWLCQLTSPLQIQDEQRDVTLASSLTTSPNATSAGGDVAMTAALSSESFLAANPFVRAVLRSQFHVRISPMAYRILAQELERSEAVLLSMILHDHIVLDRCQSVVAGVEVHPDALSTSASVFSTDAAVVVTDPSSLISLAGYSTGEGPSAPSAASLGSGLVSIDDASASSTALSLDCGAELLANLTLGVPGTVDITNAYASRSLLFQDLKMPDLTGEDPLLVAWMDNLILPKLALERQALVPSAAKKLKYTYGPLVSTANASSESAYTPLFKEPTQSAQNISEPDLSRANVIFATVGNTHEELNCLHTNRSVTQVVAGGADCTVRAWRLDEIADASRPSAYFGCNISGIVQGYEETIPKPQFCFQNQSSGQNNVSNTANNASGNGQYRSDMMIENAGLIGRYSTAELVGHSQPIFSVHQNDDPQSNGDSRLVLSASADETVRLWDLSLLQTVGKYTIGCIPWEVRFSPLDYYFAVARQDRCLAIYTTDRTTPVRLCMGHSSDVNTVDWHPNGILLATGSDDRSVRLWDVRSARGVQFLRGSSSPITTVSWSPVGNLLAAGTESGKVCLWDPRSSKQLAILHGHEGSVYSTQFSSDGSALVSGGQDCSLRLWNLWPALESPFIGYEKLGTPNAQGAASIASMAYSASTTLVLRPTHTFFTKATLVYNVGFTSGNLIYGAGPCSIAAATYSRENQVDSKSSAITGRARMSEQAAIGMLGLAGAHPANF